MESLGDIYRHAFTPQSPLYVDETEHIPPSCPICLDSKHVSVRVRKGVFEYPPCICSRSGLQESLRRYANLPKEECWLHQFKAWNPQAELVLQQVMDLAVDFGNWPRPILTLTGGVGTGKSHLLQGLGRVALESQAVVKYIYVPDWMESLRATYGDSDIKFDDVYAPIEQATILLLDDIGSERQTPFTKEVLGRVVDYRYRNGEQLVSTTNIVPWECDAASILGDRLADRLFDTSSGRVDMAFTGMKSYRRDDG